MALSPPATSVKSALTSQEERPSAETVKPSLRAWRSSLLKSFCPTLPNLPLPEGLLILILPPGFALFLENESHRQPK